MEFLDFLFPVLNFMGQSMQSGMSYEQHQEDLKFNAEEAQKQRDWTEKMWNLSNEYSSPLAAMQRYKEAGLNPNLIYGSGASSIAAHVGSGSAARANATPVQIPDFSSAVVTAMSMKKMQQEIDLLNAEELLRREEAKNRQKEREGKEIENMFNRDAYQLKLDALQAENSLKAAYANTEVSKRAEIEATVKQLDAQCDYIVGQTQNEKTLTDARKRQIDTEIDNSIKQTASIVNRNNAEANKALADAWLARVEAQIKNDTENTERYKDSKLRTAIANTQKAIAEGDAAKTEAEMKEMKTLLYRAGMTTRMILAMTVDPLFESVGKVLGGVFSISPK